MPSKKLKNSKGEPLKLSYRHLVVGSSLEALLFAYYGRHHIVWTQNLCPLPFETLREDFGLGVRLYDIWSHHAFLMGLSGLMPFGDNINTIRLLDDGTLKLVSREDYTYDISYEHLHVFDDNNFRNIGTPEKRLVDAYRVIDWFSPVYMETWRLADHYHRSDPLFRDTYLYPGANDSKNVCAFSYCTERQINADKFPVYLATLKMESYLKDLTGIDSPRARSRHTERQVLNLSRNLYRDRDNIKFYNISPRMVYEVSRSQKLDYTTYLKDRLCI